MKSKHEKMVIFFTLVVAFSSSPIIVFNSLFSMPNSNVSLNDFSKINSKIKDLKSSGNSDVIIIDNNWTAAKAMGICTGTGTYTNPYVIKNITISNFQGASISITNSNEYFRIQNCNIKNSIGTPAYAINLMNTHNGVITNNSFSNIRNGISLSKSNSITISSNIINNTGISLDQSNQNNISNNVITKGGISMVNCQYITLSENHLINCSLYIGSSLVNGNWEKYLNNINRHNNKPLYYYKNKVNLNPDDFLNAGQVIIANCNDSIISNLDISQTSKAITLYLCYGNTLTNNTLRNNDDGIYLMHSENNMISENEFVDNNYFTIYLDSSINNQILKNNIVSNSKFGTISRGVFLSSCLSNEISKNSVINCTNGIELKNSYKNVISANNVKKCTNGIQLFDSSNNEISKNTLNKNFNGILLVYGSSYNFISENNVIDFDHIGIYLVYDSNFNTISGNTLKGDGTYIKEIDCSGNIFWDNGWCIYGYPSNWIIFFSILIAVITFGIILYRFVKKKARIKNFSSQTIISYAENLIKIEKYRLFLLIFSSLN